MMPVCRALLGLCLIVVFAPVMADTVPARPGEAVMVPERHLRDFDPVTVFFDRPQVDQAGPIASPPAGVAFQPQHPGAWTWLDNKTLQFRPADPWPALQRFVWSVQGRQLPLVTLMAPAIASQPANHAQDLAPIDALVLQFREPVSMEALGEMLRMEVYAHSSLGEQPLRVLSREQLSIQPVERSHPSQPAAYRVRLPHPVAEGRELRVLLRLSLEDDPERAFQTLRYRTRSPFQPRYLGCAGQQRSISPAGSVYPEHDALLCRADQRAFELGLSAEAVAPGPVLARQLFRFEPRVENLQVDVLGQRLRVRGDFDSDTVYRVVLQPAALLDVHGRALQLDAESRLSLRFPALSDFLQLNQGKGRVMMEARGPQMLPLRGRGDARVDLRVHAIDAEDLRFWPFYDAPVRVAESQRPPGPGEHPEARKGLRMSEYELSQRIAALGSPSIAELLPLPLANTQQAARFGLDLAPHLSRLHGEQQPGHYLVGVRRVGEGDQRQWVRLQVTDLALSVIEEETSVRFVVSSLASGKPLPGAEVLVQAPPPRNGSSDELLVTLASGRTDRDGAWRWQPTPNRYQPPPERLLVRYGQDRLVIDVSEQPPARFQDGYLGPANGWLDWTVSPQQRSARVEEASWQCHLFTERPVYRNEDEVHISGFVRRVHRGEIQQVDAPVHLLVRGPDGSEWRHSQALDEAGGFYHRFDQATPASGDYLIEVAVGKNQQRRVCDRISIEKTPYRLPRFEVDLDGPQRVAMDRPFEVALQADYYAGGAVAEQRVSWRVTQFPYRWLPAGREGFAFSSDARYASLGGFESQGQISRSGQTDTQGGASLSLDPTEEASAQPRRYVIEATVTGADDQTVTDTHQVMALPPFVLGLKAPRYLQQADRFTAEALMVGPDDELLAGKDMQLKLVRRRWLARLQAGDFSDGQPRYETEVVDETIVERELQSAEQALEIELPLADTGVYLLELSARDALGRTQTLTLDLFNDAEARATWPKPPAPTFEVSSEQEAYAPGETARLILQSPLAEATVLAVVEQPDGSQDYHWLEVEQGRAVLELPVRREHLPSLPVQFMLMRGRLGEQGVPEVSADGLDLAKPVTMFASHRIAIKDSAHRLEVALEHAAKAQPGDTLSMRIRLEDGRGQPRAGFVTLWLVDQAVLALGDEQPLDMLADFLRYRPTRTSLRDTRNRPVGYLPFLTEPGGDGAMLERAMLADMAGQLLNNLTVRERFASVPYFQHAIAVDASGEAEVEIQLPDDLTNFMVRAKAVAGDDRFGHQGSQVAVRLPVIVQPSLPRFLRYGDQAVLSATSRVVDGELGEGRAAIALEGLQSEAALVQTFRWADNATQRLDLPVSVPIPEALEQGQTFSASVSFGVERKADGVGDAFAVDLPLLPDRRVQQRHQHVELAPGETATLSGADEAVRPGSLQRSLLLSDQPASLLMAAGLNQLMHYPHFCTEQRVSQARAMLAARELLLQLDPQQGTERLDQAVHSTLAYLQEAQNEQGLMGYWPGDARGNVAVSSWAMHLLVEARAAGFAVDGGLHQRLHNGLQRGLRGGHEAYFSRYLERTMALTALAADGALDSGYAAELARRSQFLGLEATAHVAQALAMEANPGPQMLKRLADAIWQGVRFELRDGEPVYSGLAEQATATSPVILPSETRTIARVLQALQAMPEANDRRRQLIDVLVQLGQGNGWGSTNANAEAILALSRNLEQGDTNAAEWAWVLGDEAFAYSGADGLRRETLSHAGDLSLALPGASPALGALHQLRYLPAALGDQAEGSSEGLVVTREAVIIDGQTERRQPWQQAGQSLKLEVGQIVEDRLTLVTPSERFHVAVVMPLAAGMELLNPSLQTAPPEAEPSQPLTLTPSHVAWRDDSVAFYYQQLPAGQYQFAVRQRAQIPGRFTQPQAYAELMYQAQVQGQSVGARIDIARPETR
jgi:hypothetical protein